MELNLGVITQFIQQYAGVLSFALFMVAFVLAFLLVQRIGSELFTLYKRNFYANVDKGLRDIVALLEPGQIFTITVIAAAVVGPLVFFVFNVVAAAVAVGITLFAPRIILRILKEKRSNKFVQQMPDALSAMASSMRSGLNLVKALQQVVKNQPDPIAQEFAQMLVEYRVGNDLNDSLDALGERIGRDEVILMNSAIKIARAVGGNLADTFDILARTLREKYKVEGKIKALTSMGKAQGNLAMGFPVFMGYVFYKLEPEAMGLLFTSTLGQIWIGVMVAMALLGALLIKKVVTVDV